MSGQRVRTVGGSTRVRLYTLYTRGRCFAFPDSRFNHSILVKYSVCRKEYGVPASAISCLLPEYM